MMTPTPNSEPAHAAKEDGLTLSQKAWLNAVTKAKPIGIYDDEELESPLMRLDPVSIARFDNRN